MKGAFVIRSHLGKCKPCARITDGPISIAISVCDRLRNMHFEGGAYMQAFVVGENVHAMLSTAWTARAATAHQIIGTYTKLARPDDIAEDVAAWIGEACKAEVRAQVRKAA
jgi:hypothetical protein